MDIILSTGLHDLGSRGRRYWKKVRRFCRLGPRAVTIAVPVVWVLCLGTSIVMDSFLPDSARQNLSMVILAIALHQEWYGAVRAAHT